MANWALFMSKGGTDNVVVGPLHHVEMSTYLIDNDSQRAFARFTLDFSDQVSNKPAWKIEGRDMMYQYLDICDGDENPWPEFEVLSLDDIAGPAS